MGCPAMLLRIMLRPVQQRRSGVLAASSIAVRLTIFGDGLLQLSLILGEHYAAPR